MVGSHDKAILLVHSVEMETSLLDDSVHALNSCKENISTLETDMVLHLEATLCHCQIICLSSTEVSVVFLHSGLSCWTSLPNKDLIRGCCRRHVSVWWSFKYQTKLQVKVT